ncbi:protein of unknown function DUF115 [Pseudobacteroides cellulosolvens ATCC 35603 = DSM 2933]|uniref:DUF115 domain-containing protein n=2 Tax=Pseudobacteroides cellulosolvens TaxID=35825 RepID=A0A0L6JKX3_9FIRM|nr:protein of unknown function DUF115 [Pseudobacteroides cellulosolvens ATCC 35603 = DSM 2933]
MNEVLQKNLKLLEKHQPNVYKKIQLYTNNRYVPQNNIIEKIVLAKQGDIIINMLVKINGEDYILCDHEDPINEAYRWIDKYIDPTNKADIVFGMGFGYHLEVLLTGFKNKKVIIVEPDISLFFHIISIRNLELIIKKSEILLDESIENVLERVKLLLWDTRQGGIQCEPFEVYGYMFDSLWDDLRSKFIKQAENFNVDFSTKRVFGELWTANSLENSQRINEASNFQGLIGKFTGMPGILISAGPSLRKNIHLLKEIQDKAVLMAAGKAVAVLEEYGITPHFMVGIDASEAEAELHSKVKSSNIYFIYTNQIAAGSVKSYRGPKFLMNYPVDNFTSEFLKFANIKSEYVLSGPSVANTCGDLLFRMGCNPIILVGQDLAYTGRRVNEAENNDPNLVLENDVFGQPIYTNTVFLAMRNWFESYFEKIKDKVEVFNATEGGLNIENIKNCRLEELISRIKPVESDIEALISRIYKQSRFDIEMDKKLGHFTNRLGAEISKFERLFNEQESIVDSIAKDIYHPSKNKNLFNKMAKRVSEITDMLMDSEYYNVLLKNLVDIDFYLIKLEVDRATKEYRDYGEIKQVFTKAMKHQIILVKDRTQKIKGYMEASSAIGVG